MDNEPVQTTAIIIPFPKRQRPAAHRPAVSEGLSFSKSHPAAQMPTPPVTRPLPAALSPLTHRAFVQSLVNSTAPSAPVAKPPSARPGAAPLSGVMAELDNALTQQGAAVARWRKAINDLRVAMDGLEGSLQQYRASLPPANGGVART